MTLWTQCPVGLDHPRPCGGAVRQVSPTRWECALDATHAWTNDGVPAVTVETVAEVKRTMSDHLDGPIEIRRNSDGSIDEILARDIAQIHVEQMDARHWWIGIYAHDGRSWMVNLTTPRATISCHIEADELGGSDV